MTVPCPDLSVIIPTHNRRRSVERTLLALARQTCDPQRFEAIVVADGCTDDTTAFLATMRLPFRLTVVEQLNQGQGKARNEGAARARGELLVFLDDDIEALPGLLDAYREAHQQQPDHLLIGQSTPVLENDSSLFHVGLRNWWRDHIAALKMMAHRYTYRDMHSGNFAIAATLFARVGGFDPDFFGRSGEDYEFGVRLMQMGVPFIFIPRAEGNHNDTASFERSLLRVRMEGRADALIGRRHPALRAGLTPAWFRVPDSPAMRWLRDTAFQWPRIGAQFARLLESLLGPLQWLRLRKKWRRVHGAVRAYWYSRGVADELGTLAALEDFLLDRRTGGGMLLDLDLAPGIAQVRRTLDQVRPAAVRLRIGSVELGDIPEVPGAEPLSGRHLGSMLAPVGPRLLAALAIRALSEPDAWSRFFQADDAPAHVGDTPFGEPTPWVRDEMLTPVLQPGSTAAHHGRTLGKAVERRVDSPLAPEAVVPRHNDNPGRWRVTEFELANPVTAINCEGNDFIAALVRFQGRPLGWVQRSCSGSSVDGVTLVDAALERFGRELALAALPQVDPAPNPPPISVVICTRDRAQLLERCLTHVARLGYPNYEIIVVDNASSDGATRDVAARFPVRYVREDRPGLDWARNRGIAEARYGIVAFTDDDATPDAGWLHAIAAGFESPAIMAVTGLVAPMELATEAQLLFEQVYGGMGKGVHGRLFHRDRMRPSQMIAIHALGVGANMAFRREALERLGGFDTALDVGTAACGGGDLDMFHRVIAAGMPLWYEPRALVWHQHRREIADLRRQLYNDGRSFAVYLLKLWRDRTVPRRSVARYAVWVWGRWLAGRVILGALGRHRLPFSVLWANLRGAVDGPRAFRATYRQDRMLKASAKV